MTIEQNAPTGNTNFRRVVSSPEARAIKQNHQQLQHVVNRILNFLDMLDKAARASTTIAELMGHMDPKTTRRYTHAIDRAKHAAVEATRPRTQDVENEPAKVISIQK